MICKSLIDPGHKIDLQIDLPIAVAGATRSFVSARGRVVRNVTMTGLEKEYGHGIMFDNYNLLRV